MTHLDEVAEAVLEGHLRQLSKITRMVKDKLTENPQTSESAFLQGYVGEYLTQVDQSIAAMLAEIECLRHGIRKSDRVSHG